MNAAGWIIAVFVIFTIGAVTGFCMREIKEVIKIQNQFTVKPPSKPMATRRDGDG